MTIAIANVWEQGMRGKRDSDPTPEWSSNVVRAIKAQAAEFVDRGLVASSRDHGPGHPIDPYWYENFEAAAWVFKGEVETPYRGRAALAEASVHMMNRFATARVILADSSEIVSTAVWRRTRSGLGTSLQALAALEGVQNVTSVRVEICNVEARCGIEWYQASDRERWLSADRFIRETVAVSAETRETVRTFLCFR